MLHEVGFWCQLDGADASLERPDPRELVDSAWLAAADPALLQRLQWYLTRGAFIESHELAYSYCRFVDCVVAQREPKAMGACTLTDGVFCWPEAYWHYVQSHNVKPPPAFLQHIDANAERLQRIAAEHPQSLLLWDDCEQRAAPMPRAMQQWITTHTTIQIADASE